MSIPLITSLYNIPQTDGASGSDLITSEIREFNFNFDSISKEDNAKSSVLWNFGDPDSPNNEIISSSITYSNVSHEYNKPGIYKVTAIANVNGVLFFNTQDVVILNTNPQNPDPYAGYINSTSYWENIISDSYHPSIYNSIDDTWASATYPEIEIVGYSEIWLVPKENAPWIGKKTTEILVVYDVTKNDVTTQESINFFGTTSNDMNTYPDDWSGDYTFNSNVAHYPNYNPTQLLDQVYISQIDFWTNDISSLVIKGIYLKFEDFPPLPTTTTIDLYSLPSVDGQNNTWTVWDYNTSNVLYNGSGSIVTIPLNHSIEVSRNIQLTYYTYIKVIDNLNNTLSQNLTPTFIPEAYKTYSVESDSVAWYDITDPSFWGNDTYEFAPYPLPSYSNGVWGTVGAESTALGTFTTSIDGTTKTYLPFWTSHTFKKIRIEVLQKKYNILKIKAIDENNNTIIIINGAELSGGTINNYTTYTFDFPASYPQIAALSATGTIGKIEVMY